MPRTAFGRNVLTVSLATRPPSTHRLGDTDGIGCHLASCQHLEELEGVEVIADDFLIAGFGNTEHEVNQSLERNERAFLEKCRLWNLKLNRAKVTWHQPSVKFMGHLLTSQGLMPDPEKIQAILQMPEPEDVTALKPFLGMVTYLAKFMPHLTEPLRRLEDKNVEFQ